MLRATLFPAPYHSLPVLTRGATQTSTCHSLAPARAVHAGSSLVSLFDFHIQHLRRPRVSLCAARLTASSTSRRRARRRGGTRTDDEFNFYDDDDDDDNDDVVFSGSEDDEDDDDVVEDEGMVPLEQMRKWLKNKPRGFGEGKVYDTSAEDKLLEEMRQSREAQAANLKKLKSSPVKSNNTDQNKKDSPVVPIGGRVRLVNLPKKKNIHRDLKVAFEGIPDIVNIVPAVTGNKKTRDPVCKGFAFVDFKREADAVRFVELYSGQSITFGKIQKQIKCELVNAHSSASASLESSENLNAAPQFMVSAVEEDSNDDSNMEDSALSSWDGATSDDSDDINNKIYEEEEEEEEEEGIVENQDSATALMVDYDDDVEMGIDSEFNSLSLEQANKSSTAEQKSSAKVKQENARKKKKTSKVKAKKGPKLDVPGSAKRLKIKEKAVLSDVFSKYGSKTALASKDS